MDGQNRKNIRPGIMVDIVLKADQPTGELTRGVVAQILTSSGVHPRGIKVRLTSGQVGRVQAVIDDRPQAGMKSTPQRKSETSPHPPRSRGGSRQRPGGKFETSTHPSLRTGREKGRDRGRSDARGFGRGTKRAEPEYLAPSKKSACDCCGYLTLEQKNVYEICHVCYWEDDPGQAQNLDSPVGSNHISLNQARKNFSQFGACEERYVKAVRRPTAQEIKK